MLSVGSAIYISLKQSTASTPTTMIIDLLPEGLGDPGTVRGQEGRGHRACRKWRYKGKNKGKLPRETANYSGLGIKAL